MKTIKSGGGWPAVKYALALAHKVGWRRFWRAARSRNACKTCALGMGGQLGGMRNELGRWPEICKKSVQAMAADMQPGLSPAFFQHNGFAELRDLTPRRLESAGRLVQPLYAGPDDARYRPIEWDDALRRIAEKLRLVSPNECFFYTSGRSSNEAGFLLQLFARLYGTNNVNNCSYYCHQASGVGLSDSIGSGTATVVLDDVEHADLFVLIGGNPASNHPRLMRTLVNIRRRGGHVLVINPVIETGLVKFRVPSDVRSMMFATKIASLYVQPHIGGDIALLTGVAKAIAERGAVDADFISRATDGWEEYRAHLAATDWRAIEHGSGIERPTIERIADLYCAAKSAVFGWTMGITHHEHGVQNVQTIVNVALLRGMIGRRHCGLLPIRGHSNVQGIGSVGVTPALKDAVLKRLKDEYGVHPPPAPGLDTFACMEAAQRGLLRFGWCLGGNLYGSNPDAASAEKALINLEMIVYLSTTLNTGHARGRAKETIVLPVLARDEEPQKTTQESMFNYVRLSDGGPRRHLGPRHEVSVIAHLARAVLGDNGPIDWHAMERHETIRHFIARIIPGYEKIGEIDRTGREFQIAGRTLHTPRFPTPTGRAQFKPHAIPAPPAGNGKLRLMTVRSEGQFNTVVYEEEDIYRGQTRRDVILMNQTDIDRLGLKIGDRAVVRSAVGEMADIRVAAYDIRAGNALMYYPEANRLVPAVTDPRSKTPAFKSVQVDVTPAACEK